MIRVNCFVAVSLALVTIAAGALFRTNKQDYRYRGDDVGSPLFLTPYIESGQLDKGRSLSKVTSIRGINQVSYTGYITVNKAHESNLFFWFWPSQKDPSNDPLLLWLQGGPGGPSLFGMFVETGPYYIAANYSAVPRNVTWNSKYSTLYIDQPVGTGYSFTKRDAGYVTNQAAVARDLYNCLLQFFTLFPDYQHNDFYLTGESYAGKYIPATAYKIHIENLRAKLKINLKGVAIGDGFIDPVSMIPQYADYIFQLGMFDENERDYFRGQVDKIVSCIKRGEFLKAFSIYDEVLGGDLISHKSYFFNVTGSSNYDNFLRMTAPASYEYYEKFVTTASVRRAIHVANLTFNSGQEVERHLTADLLKSEKPSMTVVMDNYRVLLYSGQLDIIVAVPLTEAFLQIVPWEGLNEYKTVKKLIWKLDSNVAGYVRNVREFYQVLVRGGGHILPHDQPARCLDMISRFIERRSFTTMHKNL